MPEYLARINSPLDWILVAVLVYLILLTLRNNLMAIAAASAGRSIQGGKLNWLYISLVALALWLVNR